MSKSLADLYEGKVETPIVSAFYDKPLIPHEFKTGDIVRYKQDTPYNSWPGKSFVVTGGLVSQWAEKIYGPASIRITDGYETWTPHPDQIEKIGSLNG